MLSLSDVGVRFADKTIVSSFSLDIAPGSIHALMGPNGSGKSTLSLALAGHPHYELEQASTISLDGINLVPLLPHERARTGLFLSFQSPVAIPGISVKQMMKIMVDHLSSKKVPVKKILEALKEYSSLVGISEGLLERSIHDGFSGGEKKRLEMLALLMAKPKYAILDEIDSGLDVDAIKMITGAIALAQKECNTGFLIVTHYRRILEYLPVDAVHVLAQGTMIKSGKKALINEIETSGYQGLV